MLNKQIKLSETVLFNLTIFYQQFSYTDFAIKVTRILNEKYRIGGTFFVNN